MKTIEQKAAEYAAATFGDNIKQLLEKPWPETRKAFENAYLAGASEALSSQWIDPGEIDPGDRLPGYGERICVCYRTKYKGAWLTIFTVCHRDDYADIFTDKDEDIIAWMPIPPVPARI